MPRPLVTPALLRPPAPSPHTPWHWSALTLQILTIEELLSGKKINMPPSKQVNVTHRRAPRAKGKPSEEMGELFDKG